MECDFLPVTFVVAHLTIGLDPPIIDLYVFSVPLVIHVAAYPQTIVLDEEDPLPMLLPLPVHLANIPLIIAALQKFDVLGRLHVLTQVWAQRHFFGLR